LVFGVSQNSRRKSAAHSSRTLLRGGYQIPAVFKQEPRQSKSFSSRKNSFCFASAALNPTARALTRSRAEKLSFPFRRIFGGVSKSEL
jgi:hypothetical protein